MLTQFEEDAYYISLFENVRFVIFLLAIFPGWWKSAIVKIRNGENPQLENQHLIQFI